MSLSVKAKEYLTVALSNAAVAKEIAAAIDASGSGPAVDVAANSAASAVTVTTAGGNTYADSAVNAALVSVVADINADRVQINAILTALKNAGLML